jgi:transposase-like protein
MSFPKKKTRRKYDSSFKEDVIKMATAGRPISEISNSLGVSASLIHRWCKTIPGSNKKSKDSASSLDINTLHQIEQLKADLRRTEQERDILKKALAIFSRVI